MLETIYNETKCYIITAQIIPEVLGYNVLKLCKNSVLLSYELYLCQQSIICVAWIKYLMSFIKKTKLCICNSLMFSKILTRHFWIITLSRCSQVINMTRLDSMTLLQAKYCNANDLRGTERNKIGEHG